MINYFLILNLKKEIDILMKNRRIYLLFKSDKKKVFLWRRKQFKFNILSLRILNHDTSDHIVQLGEHVLY